MVEAVKKDPFRLFFPLGALIGLIGVVPWLSQSTYPREFHRVLMINGFLLSFVAGFLMTAMPRFTNAAFAASLEIAAVLAAIVAAVIAAFTVWAEYNFLFSALALFSLFGFAAKRFARRKTNPPHTFVFIGLGLFLWFLSNACQFVSVQQVLAQDIFSNGAIMSLVLGVGGRLIPGILGWQEIVAVQRKEFDVPGRFFQRIPVSLWIAFLLFLFSFLGAIFWPMQWCYLLRGCVTFYFGIRYWKIHRIPKSKSFLTWSLWISCWCLAMGYFVPVLWAGGVHGLHMLFIGGFSLITLLVSSRVIFAHSAGGTDIEKTSRSIVIFTGLILLSMVTRVTAVLLPEIYLTHLKYAAAIWIAALLIWTLVTVKKIIQPSQLLK